MIDKLVVGQIAWTHEHRQDVNVLLGFSRHIASLDVDQSATKWTKLVSALGSLAEASVKWCPAGDSEREQDAQKDENDDVAFIGLENFIVMLHKLIVGVVE